MRGIVKDARALGEEITGKPKEEVGWRDVVRLNAAIGDLAGECERLGKAVSAQAERLQEATDVAEAIEKVASGDGHPDDGRLAGLAERLMAVLNEEEG